MLKKIIAILSSLSIATAALVPHAYAQTGGAAKFQITAPATAVVGEAFDVTVTALDKDGNKAAGYTSSIIFNTDYMGDTFPMPGRPIPFTAEDAGEKKFSKGVIFKKPGKQKLRVLDVTQDISGEVTITVEEGNGTAATSSGEITILTPVADGKITTPSVLVSGTARKNSKIQLELNGQKIGTAVSDADGLFTYEIQSITQDSNVLKASLIDATDAVIATSPEVKFSKASDSSSVYGISITPGTTVESGTSIKILIDAQKGLSSVNATLDGTLLTAKETSEGKYTISTVAPLKAGSYPIDVTAKTITNQETSKPKMATLTVTEKAAVVSSTGATSTGVTATVAKTPAFKNIKTETKDSRVIFTFSVENPPVTLDAFKISYGSGSVTTQS